MCIGIAACTSFISLRAENSSNSVQAIPPNVSKGTNAVAPQRNSFPRVVNTREEMLTLVSGSVARIEEDLTDPHLTPEHRERLEKTLLRRKETLAYYQTNNFVPVTIGTNSPRAEARQIPPPIPAPTPMQAHTLPLPPGGMILPQRAIRLPGTSSLVQSNYTAQVQLMRTNPAAARTNGFNPIVVSLQQSVADYEWLATNGDPVLRKTYATLAQDRKAQLADFTTNAQLWANLHQARESKDPDNVRKAKQALADYLGGKIGMPSGTSYDEVMNEYHRRVENDKASAEKE